jgi:hypothetical protein
VPRAARRVSDHAGRSASMPPNAPSRSAWPDPAGGVRRA